MLDDILAKDPNNAGVLVARGGWLLREGKVSEASRPSRKGGGRRPSIGRRPCCWGAVHARGTTRSRPSAITRRFCSCGRGLHPTQVELARLNLAAASTKEAGEFARQAVASAPNLAAPRHAVARVLFAEGRLSEAERELAPCLRRDRIRRRRWVSGASFASAVVIRPARGRTSSACCSWTRNPWRPWPVWQISISRPKRAGGGHEAARSRGGERGAGNGATGAAVRARAACQPATWRARKRRFGGRSTPIRA